MTDLEKLEITADMLLEQRFILLEQLDSKPQDSKTEHKLAILRTWYDIVMQKIADTHKAA